jgi:hypothetical protein
MLLLWIKVDYFIPIILPNLNLICHLLALEAHHILHVGRIRVKPLKEEQHQASVLHWTARHLHVPPYCEVILRNRMAKK